MQRYQKKHTRARPALDFLRSWNRRLSHINGILPLTPHQTPSQSPAKSNNTKGGKKTGQNCSTYSFTITKLILNTYLRNYALLHTSQNWSNYFLPLLISSALLIWLILHTISHSQPACLSHSLEIHTAKRTSNEICVSRLEQQPWLNLYVLEAAAAETAIT